jgi:hypothetical protein
VVLRLGLGEEKKAQDNAKTFRSKFGGANAKQAAQIACAIAAH